MYTEWFHSDYLADYYHVDVFSEEYWRIVENFLRKAKERGVNMILTPILTLPLDTLIGGERTTTQFVGGVTKKNEEYFFDYTKFHRWITLCKEIGFDYFEMSHLFSQWGAKFPPKIVAEQRLKESGKRFLDAGMEDGWTYYCVGQGYKVSNRFIAMPGWRRRILGVQLYKYRMEGFLHWGFNFYNTQYSLHPVDPYRENDADDAFPAGDAFIVYPGENGEVVESMRLPLIEDAMLDVRLLEYLEELTDRETVMKLVEQNESFEIRFDEYPRGAEYLLNL